MKVFKHIGMLLISLLLLASCGSKQDTDKIVVVSREEGSGTRGAFIELLKIEEKNSDGVKVDHTTLSAVTTNSTAIMLTTVANDKVAIGHSSLGALNKTVKTVTIDGASATVENIKSGQYKIARSFNIVTLATVSPETQDFINYILSQDGQAVVEKTGYIPIDNAKPYQAMVNSGKVVVSGSSSVTPVMEKNKRSIFKN